MLKKQFFLFVVAILFFNFSAIAQSGDELLTTMKGSWYFQKVELGITAQSPKDKAFKKELEGQWKADFLEGHRIFFSDASIKRFAINLGDDDTKTQKGTFALENEGEFVVLTHNTGKKDKYKMSFKDEDKTMVLTPTKANGAKADLVFKKSGSK